MGESEQSSVRLYGSTYERLKSLKREGESIKDVLNRVMPDDVDEVERIDENVVGLPAPSEVTEQINKMAGENVSANDVVDRLIDEHQDKHE